jgi:hypothetical protein
MAEQHTFKAIAGVDGNEARCTFLMSVPGALVKSLMCR